MKPVFMLLFAYLLGSVPTGFLLGYFSGVDVRQAGSGNVGASNVARVVGKRQGLITLVADVAKGFIPVIGSLELSLGPVITSLVALAAFLGHLFPIFLRFRGGKGVATSLGVFLALAPLGAGVLILIFCLVARLGRIVSLASLTTAALAPVVLWLFSSPAYVVGLSLFLALGIIFRHWENIQRLISGVEPRLNF